MTFFYPLHPEEVSRGMTIIFFIAGRGPLPQNGSHDAGASPVGTGDKPFLPDAD